MTSIIFLVKEKPVAKESPVKPESTTQVWFHWLVAVAFHTCIIEILQNMTIAVHVYVLQLVFNSYCIVIIVILLLLKYISNVFKRLN